MNAAQVGAGAPFVVGALLLLLSPWLTKKCILVIRGQIAEDSVANSAVGQPTPPHLTGRSLDDYFEYLSDAVQIVPITLLPVLGAVFTVATGLSSITALSYLAVTVVFALGADAWILSQHPSRYVSKKRMGYSVLTIVGVVMNVLGLTLVLAGEPTTQT